MKKTLTPLIIIGLIVLILLGLRFTKNQRKAQNDTQDHTGLVQLEETRTDSTEENSESTKENDLEQDIKAKETQGYNMLLMGNSFFKPYANRIGDMAIDAGFTEHTDTLVFRGGFNGTPIALWNDKGENNKKIKEILDAGDVDIFGMVITDPNETNDPLDGYRQWVSYAVKRNPDISIFISLSSPDFPDDWEERAGELGASSIEGAWGNFVDETVHATIIDSLRKEFPGTHIFSIPTGQATFDLLDLYNEGLLQDDIAYRGSFETSLFTDEKGHQGEIIAETGALVWLEVLYDVDLSTNEYDTGFKTDLHAIAADIMDNHDPEYQFSASQQDFIRKEENPVSEKETVPAPIQSSEAVSISVDEKYDVLVEKDLVYGYGLGYKGRTAKEVPLLLDIYIPDNGSTNRPMFMFIHGGGFKGGTKTKPEIVEMANYFASRGWVFASVDYRTVEELGDIQGMSPDDLVEFYKGIAPAEWVETALEGARGRDQVQQAIAMYAAQRDNKAALRWVVSNADTYDINTDYITVGGASAGAITTVAMGISDQGDFRDEISVTDDPTLKTTNLDAKFDIAGMVYFWGSNMKLDVFELVYGLSRYDSDDPELFMAHGDGYDPVTPYSEALELQEIYQSLGVYSELATLEGKGHGAWNAQIDGKSLFDLSFDFVVERQGLDILN